MIACDTNIVVQAAVFHAKDPADTKHMPRLSADFLRSRNRRQIRIPDIVYGELLLGTVSPQQMRMRELFMKKLVVLDSSMASRWAASKLRRLLKRGHGHNADCLAYMTSALHNANLFVSWDSGLSGKITRFKIQAAPSVILKRQLVPSCPPPAEVMPHHNPKKRRRLTEDQKVMKFCREYRARAWRRVRAIVGPDEDDQIDYMCGLAKAHGMKTVPSPV